MHACRAQPIHRHLRDIVDLRQPQSMMASDDEEFVTNYWYDTDSERTVKVWARASRYINLRIYKLTHQHDQVHTLGEPLSRGKPRLTIHQAHLYSQPEYRIQNL